MIRKLIAPAAALVVAYLAIAFTMWECNPEHWGAVMRYLAAFLGFVFGGIVFGAQEGLE